MLLRSLRRVVPCLVVLGCSAPPSPGTPQAATPDTGPTVVPAGSSRSRSADKPPSSPEPSASAAPAAPAVRRKPTYSETLCPAGTIADGSLGAKACYCCEPFGIPCPDSSVLAPKPGETCTVFGSENDACLWKCE